MLILNWVKTFCKSQGRPLTIASHMDDFGTSFRLANEALSRLHLEYQPN